MLLGEFPCTTDKEGRLSVPEPFRADLAAGLILTRGIDRCLWGLPRHVWEELTAKVQARHPLTNRDARSFARLIYAQAMACAPDAHDTIPLPDSLRGYAGIEDQAIWVGLGDYVEIWSPERWQELRAQLDEGGESTAEKLIAYGV